MLLTDEARGQIEANHSSQVLITKIQRFSLHDGPGIRTTVFLKGCSLCCPWCSNPENIEPYLQPYCLDKKLGTYGRYISCDELYEKVTKDRAFYRTASSTCSAKDAAVLENLPGGITFSGGEPLLQIKNMKPLLLRLKNENIHTAIETSLFAMQDQLELALEYVDLFYVDIKIPDKKRCSRILKGNVDIYLQNLGTLFDFRDERMQKKMVVFRVPVIGGYTDMLENRRGVIRLLESFRPIKVELIQGHNLGDSKYRSLGMPVPQYNSVTTETLEEYTDEISSLGVKVQLCKV